MDGGIFDNAYDMCPSKMVAHSVSGVSCVILESNLPDREHVKSNRQDAWHENFGRKILTKEFLYDRLK